MRIIARLDVQPPHVVKPIQYEGLRKLGTPNEMANKYYRLGVDEIIYIDIVSSLYRRDPIFDLIEAASQGVFVPIAAGGGIRSLEDALKIIKFGADKVVLNTHAILSPGLIKEISDVLGSQSVVINIEAKKHNEWWECYTDCGRNPTGINVLSWIDEVIKLGAGEIIISSVDNDGMQNGFDIELIKLACEQSSVPVIAASGAGSISHILDLISQAKPSGIAIASSLHYDSFDFNDLRTALNEVDYTKNE